MLLVKLRHQQLEKQDVDWNHELSGVRIHVERVIGVLKQKYILQGTLPISLLSDSDDDNNAVIHRYNIVVHVSTCAHL